MDGLVQLFRDGSVGFTFIDIGEIVLYYHCEVKERDAFGAKLAGADNHYYVARGNINVGSINFQYHKGLHIID
ncbi:hypothetical protein HYU23_02215 [Candidatus Woesearchaeota archaeon]|nr:hypothetical protein [Candidatus Woesearchaeota archaeon]